MTASIHPTAIIHPDAQIGAGVEIGAFAIVGEGCVIDDDCVIAPRVTLERNVILAPRVKIGVGSVLGGDPQDVKFKGEPTTVEIGEGAVIREYCTINRATTHSFRTTVGQGAFIMSYVHLAHDCQVGSHTIFANLSQLAGHVHVGDWAILGGATHAHQFVKIGTHSFTGIDTFVALAILWVVWVLVRVALLVVLGVTFGVWVTA